MPTLFEILKRKVSPAVTGESEVYNPIGLKLGGVLTIDELDYRGQAFTVQAIRESRLTIIATAFKAVSYDLLSAPLDGEEIRVRLLLRSTRAGRQAGYEARIFTLYNEQAYAEELHQICNDDTGLFIVDEGKETEERYWRVGFPSLRHGSYKITESVLRDVDPYEIGTSSHELWDYSRETEIDGQSVVQHMLVEMNSDNGWFQIWRGVEISPDKLNVF